MPNYILNRLGQSAVVLVLVSLIGFMVLNLAPGGPMSQFALNPGMSQAELDRIAEQLGLKRPLLVQYIDWFSHLFVGDWGNSFRDGRPVLSVIAGHLPATLLLMGTSTLLSIVIGTWVGVLGAVRRYSVFDTLATVGAMVALSIPTFWFGLVAIFLFSLHLGWLPAGNMYTIGDQSLGDYAIHLVLPVLVLALVNVAIWSRYMRSATLDVIDQDFVRTARAKGVPYRRVLTHHVIRNALLPMITLAGLQIPTILGGALITETVFTWPGMGRLFLDSLGYSDYPVIMGILMFSAVLVLLGNLLADLLIGVADPRVRLA
ncbi:ABC transporter permease [Pseudomonas coleopterorum]|uniref:ABC transporter permease n=1 Tax=Pseudomonas coleopterorum TaxID=1605838 RepID=UPI000894769C|nr:ABC transporter permease [Pseudomonas coleopterorum]SED83449.1 peptide/nickel transport system permease protein [Pseudomonas coleopterorum]